VACHQRKDCHVEGLSGKRETTMQPVLEDLYLGEKVLEKYLLARREKACF